MSVKNWIAALFVGGTAFVSGCKHESQAFLPKGGDTACGNTPASPYCADACGSKHGGKRYFTPIPCCNSPSCTAQPILPPDAPRTLPSTSAKVSEPAPTGKILPDDAPVQSVPSRLPESAYNGTRVEVPRRQSNYEPPLAEPSYVIPQVTEPTYNQPRAQPLQERPAVPEPVSIMPPAEPMKPAVPETAVVQSPASEPVKVQPPAEPVISIPTAAAPAEARTTDYSSLSGKLEYSNIKRQWRLRYAAPDGDDEYGGIVALQGLENSAVTPVEGATVRVKGQLIKPDGKTGSPEYFVHELTVVGTP